MAIPAVPSNIDDELLRAYLKTVREAEKWPLVTVDEDGDGEAEAAFIEVQDDVLAQVSSPRRCGHCGSGLVADAHGNCDRCGAPVGL